MKKIFEFTMTLAISQVVLSQDAETTKTTGSFILAAIYHF